MTFYTNITGKVLVYAPFPPRANVAARQAAQLVHVLDSQGLELRTLSSVTPVYGDQFLRFSSKKRFEPHIKQILAENHGLCIFYPQAMGFETIRQDRWKNRRIEEFRRLKFLAMIAFRKPKTVIVYPTGFSFLARVACVGIALTARVLRPNSVRLVSKKNRGLRLANKILGAAFSKPGSATTEETLFRLANKTGHIRLTPAWLQKAISQLSEGTALKSDLRVLHLVVTRLLNKPVPFQTTEQGFFDGDFDDQIADPEQQVPISRFMEHLNFKFQNDQRFDLTNPIERLEYLRWYMVQTPNGCNHALPLNASVFAAFKADCKTRAGLNKVAALRQADTKDVILPAYFWSLLHCYPRKYGRQKLGQNVGRIAFAFQVVSAHSRFNTTTDFMGESLSAYFAAPVGGIKGNLSRFELLACVLAHAPAQTRQCLRTPWQSSHLADWFSNLSRRGYPLLTAFSTAELPVLDTGVHVTGAASAETGLAKNKKMSALAMRNIATEKQFYLHHVNAGEIPAQILRNSQKDAFHIGFLLWELENTPKSHDMANQCLDEIWTPSKFVQNIYEKAYDRPVTMIGKGFDLPDMPAMDLSVYGFDRSDTVFLMCFDIHSSVARKNPLAAITAFQRAFPNSKNVKFILKTTPAPQQHWGDPEGQMNIITRIAKRDPRIVLDQRMLPFNALLGLIGAVDCIVSPHRSEGFGYFPAYALKYAKPLIVTDYSGTQDFCSTETAFPVRCQMQKANQAAIISPVAGVHWAEIDQVALTNTLCQVHDDMPAAQARAKNGQALMLDYYSAAALKKRYETRLEELGLRSGHLTERSYNVPMRDDRNTTR